MSQIIVPVNELHVLRVECRIVFRKKFRLLQMKDREITRRNDQTDKGQIGNDVRLQLQIRLMTLETTARRSFEDRSSTYQRADLGLRKEIISEG